MTTIAIGCSQVFLVTASKPMVDMLIKLGRMHYDGTCRDAVRHGGCIYGWMNHLSWIDENDPDNGIRLTNSELQTCLKIMEFPPDLSDEETALRKDFFKIATAALHQGNADERFKQLIPVVVA